MAKIQILGGGRRLIYRQIENMYFLKLIDHFIRVSSLPNEDWTTEAEAAVVTVYHPPPSHHQPVPFFQTHQRVWQAAEKQPLSPWSSVVLVLAPTRSPSILGAGRQNHASC